MRRALVGAVALAFVVPLAALACLLVISGQSASSVATAATTHPGTLSADQSAFVAELTARSSLDPAVVKAWVLAEGGCATPDQPPGNCLFQKAPDGSWAQFADPIAGADAAWANLTGNPGWYQGILDAIAAGDPLREATAIADSPWDEGHYGGDGFRLLGLYLGLADGETATATATAGQP